MQIKDKVALITGAASGIGRAAAQELIKNEVGQVALVDVADTVHEIANELNKSAGREVALPFQGDTTDEMFRKNTYDAIRRQSGVVNICIPAAGITRDALAVKLNRTKGRNMRKHFSSHRILHGYIYFSSERISNCQVIISWVWIQCKINIGSGPVG